MVQALGLITSVTLNPASMLTGGVKKRRGCSLLCRYVVKRMPCLVTCQVKADNTTRHLLGLCTTNFLPLTRRIDTECNWRKSDKRQQDIRRLNNLAYPVTPGEVRETFAKDQFIDALIDSDVRIRIKQSRPTNLNEAISLAVDLELNGEKESLWDIWNQLW